MTKPSGARERAAIAWAICPSIREYSCAEGTDPACKRCPEIVICSEGEGIQACRHAANVAADAVLALTAPRPCAETAGGRVPGLEEIADAIDEARYRHPEHPRERPRPFSEADNSDREYAMRLARAVRAMLWES